MWTCSHPYCQPNLQHNRHTFVCFHKQCHNPQYWDTRFVKYSFWNAIDPYCFHQFLGYDKPPFQNPSCPLCSCWNLGHGLHFFWNMHGLGYGLHSCWNAPSPSCSFWNPSYGLHSCWNALSPSCSFWNLGYGVHSCQNALSPSYNN